MEALSMKDRFASLCHSERPKCRSERPFVIGVSLRSFMPCKGAYLRTDVRNLKDLSALMAVRDDINDWCCQINPIQSSES